MSVFHKTEHSATDRLRPLLDWINGDPTPPLQVRLGLLAFLAAFDGRAQSAHIQVSLARQVQRVNERFGPVIEAPVDPKVRARSKQILRALEKGDLKPDDPLRFPAPRTAPQPEHSTSTESLGAQMEALRLRLRAILNGDDEPLSAPSLRFSVHQVRPPAKRSALNRRDLEAYDGDGAAVLRVEGDLMDLVPYLLMQLKTAPGMMRLARCQAPRAGDWRSTCGRWFVRVAGGAGRPRDHCSDACRQRTYDVQQSTDKKQRTRRKS